MLAIRSRPGTTFFETGHLKIGGYIFFPDPASHPGGRTEKNWRGKQEKQEQEQEQEQSK